MPVVVGKFDETMLVSEKMLVENFMEKWILEWVPPAWFAFNDVHKACVWLSYAWLLSLSQGACPPFKSIYLFVYFLSMYLKIPYKKQFPSKFSFFLHTVLKQFFDIPISEFVFLGITIIPIIYLF